MLTLLLGRPPSPFPRQLVYLLATLDFFTCNNDCKNRYVYFVIGWRMHFQSIWKIIYIVPHLITFITYTEKIVTFCFWLKIMLPWISSSTTSKGRTIAGVICLQLVMLKSLSPYLVVAFQKIGSTHRYKVQVVYICHRIPFMCPLHLTHMPLPCTFNSSFYIDSFVSLRALTLFCI